MKLINEWKQSWKFWSVQLNTLGIFLLAASDAIAQAWSMLPPSLASNVPNAKWIAMAVFVLGLIARLIPQEGLKDGEKVE